MLLAGEDLRMSGSDAVVAWAMSPSSFVVTDAVAETRLGLAVAERLQGS